MYVENTIVVNKAKDSPTAFAHLISALCKVRGIQFRPRVPGASGLNIAASTLLMPSQITSHQYGQAVLEHVQNGTYPEEEVISAELPSSALPEISKLVEQARDEVKVCLWWCTNL